MTHIVLFSLWYNTNALVHINIFLKITIEESNIYAHFEQLKVQMGNQGEE